jgi:hypothetical protein
MISPKLKKLAITWWLLLITLLVGYGILYYTQVRPVREKIEKPEIWRDWRRIGEIIDEIKRVENRENEYALFCGILILAFYGFSFRTFREEWEKYIFECRKCGHLFTPPSLKSYFSFTLINDFFFTIFYVIFKPRFFLKCPKCGKRSWCEIVEKKESFETAE